MHCNGWHYTHTNNNCYWYFHGRPGACAPAPGSFIRDHELDKVPIIWLNPRVFSPPRLLGEDDERVRRYRALLQETMH